MTENAVLEWNQERHPSFAPLAEWLLGPVRVAVLDAAITLGIADILAETDDPDVIATRLESHPGNTRLLLDALTTLGLAEKKQGHYANTPLAECYLRRDSETYLGGLIGNLMRMEHRNLPRLTELITSGPPPVARENRLDDEERWKRSARDLARYQKAGMADLAADLVASLPESPKLRCLLDLGGGPGVIGLGILARHPNMRGALCDLPAVIEVAREEIAAAGMADRVALFPGDYNTISFGSGYDLVWASLNLYYAKDLRAFLGRVLDALNSGGIFISLHEGMTDERTKPEGYVLSRLSFALEGQEVSFEAGQITEAALAAGFASGETRYCDTPMGEVQVDILRKAGNLGEATA
ncbi:MAG: methyltransferase family protein [Thermodesulfobacteriota bacterium]